MNCYNELHGNTTFNDKVWYDKTKCGRNKVITYDISLLNYTIVYIFITKNIIYVRTMYLITRKYYVYINYIFIINIITYLAILSNINIRNECYHTLYD